MSEIVYCDMRSVEPGLVRCRRPGCGREWRTTAPADRVFLRCRDPRAIRTTASAAPVAEARPEAGPCPHRGEVVRQAPCGTCGERGKLAPILACDLHGECTTRHRGIAGVANCLRCPQLPESSRPPKDATRAAAAADLRSAFDREKGA